MSDFQLFLNIHTLGFLRTRVFFLSESILRFSKMDKNNVQFSKFLKKTQKKTQKVTSEHNAHKPVFHKNILLAYFFNKIIFSLQNNLGIFLLVSYILKWLIKECQ